VTPDQFFANIKIDDNECWIWQGALKPSGYGNVWIDGVCWITHRASWFLKFGEIPAGLRVLHDCDVRACINPDHLHLGTSADNSREMVERGRYRGPAVLTLQQAHEIRSLLDEGLTQVVVARRFGVSQATISHVARNTRRLYEAVMA
jgi:hypothetical protein